MRNTRSQPLPPHDWVLDTARARLLKHFSASSLEAYGCARMPLAIRAAGALLAYVGMNNKSALNQLTRLVTYSTEQYMTLDPHTRRNLEIAEGPGGEKRRNSLMWVLDETRTPMGSRLLGRWLGQPLLDLGRLNARLDAVEAFVLDTVLRVELRTLLKDLPDLERLVARAVQGTSGPKEIVALKTAVDRLPGIRQLLAGVSESEGPRKVLGLAREPDTGLRRHQRPDRQGNRRRPARSAGHGRRYPGRLQSRVGHSALGLARRQGLDRRASKSGEKERTGIKSLKVGYNKVFGYYIEVSHANAEAVPADYIRKQTLVGAERYVTPELKEYENLILNAQERLVELERAAFGQVLARSGRVCLRA